MDRDRRDWLKRAAGVAVMLGLPGAATPAGPVRILVGFPAGGPLDIVARIIAPLLAGRVIVENHVGASGNLATAEVIRAAPDGRTLLLCGPVNTINTTLFGELDFDFARDIAPVALIASVPLIVEVNAGLPVRSVPELLAFARARPGRLRVAFAGIGTPQHIAIELFQAQAGAQVALLPYAGSAAALAALLRGDADAMFDPAPSSIPHIRAGRLVPLATTGAARATLLPDIPALAEYLPGYEAGSWFGLGAPRETPSAIIEATNAALNAGLADVAVAEQFRALGATVKPGSPAQFGDFIVADTEKYRGIIRSAGIKPA